jgi:hypothetical protein
MAGSLVGSFAPGVYCYSNIIHAIRNEMRELIQRDWRSHEKNVSPEREEIEAFFSKGGHPYSMTHSAITIQTSPDSLPSIPHWMGEVAAFAQILHQTRILTTIEERVRFARARMGTYELIDFVAILIGYALSGEPTLRAFYNRLIPFANVFMAFLGASSYPRAQLCRAFWRHSIRPAWKACEPCSRRICWPATRLLTLVGSRIEAHSPGWSPMSMEPARLLANAHSPSTSRCLPRIAVLTRCAPKATRGANAEKSCVPVPSDTSSYDA